MTTPPMQLLRVHETSNANEHNMVKKSLEAGQLVIYKCSQGVELGSSKKKQLQFSGQSRT